MPHAPLPREPVSTSTVLMTYFCQSGRWIVYYLLTTYVALARLASRGICRVCGYNLTGNVSAVCPECGAPALPKPQAPA